MAQDDPRSETTGKAQAPEVVASQFATIGKKRMEEFFNARKDLIEKLQEFEHAMARPLAIGSKA